MKETNDGMEVNSDLGSPEDLFPQAETDVTVEDTEVPAPEDDNPRVIDYTDTELDIDTGSKIRECRSCHKRVNSLSMIDGECALCAFRRMRKIEEHLTAFKQMKPVHKYCAISGHRLAAENRLFPDWTGRISINGVDLYPMDPLCAQCNDEVTAWLVRFLEQRGFSRKGCGHNDNRFGMPQGQKLSALEIADGRRRLSAFMRDVDVSVLDRDTPLHELYIELRERRKYLMSKKGKEIKERRQKMEKEVTDVWQESGNLRKKFSLQPFPGINEQCEKLGWGLIETAGKLTLEPLRMLSRTNSPEKENGQPLKKTQETPDFPDREVIMQILLALQNRVNPILSCLYSNTNAASVKETVKMLVIKNVMASDYILKLMDGEQI